MAKKTILVTPVGIAKFPHIATPDNYKGQEKYKTGLIVTKEEADAFKAKVLEFAKGNPTVTSKKPKTGVSAEVDKDDNPTGNWVINAKSSYQPAVFDSKNQRLPADTKIGGGSKLRLQVELFPYDEGVSLRLKQVQVIELHTYGDGATSGFDEVEDGYEAEGGFDSESEEAEDALDI